MESDPVGDAQKIVSEMLGVPEIVISHSAPVYHSPKISAEMLKNQVSGLAPSAKPHPKAQKKSRNERRRAKR